MEGNGLSYPSYLPFQKEVTFSNSISKVLRPGIILKREVMEKKKKCELQLTELFCLE